MEQLAKACTAASIPKPVVPGATVLSLSAAPIFNYTGPDLHDAKVDFCHVNVTLTHGSAGDNVLTQVRLPLENWNGRYQAMGGGGFVAGILDSMDTPVAKGYAASITDAGLKNNSYSAAPEMVGNFQLVKNFASVSLHDMAVVSKAVIESYYGQRAKYSYWNGCSTGGRQGMMEAQKHPEDFDGILSIAPAINMNELCIGNLAPYAAMHQVGDVPACVLDALTEYSVAACDADDGARDGLLSDPIKCDFDPHSVVGKPTKCKTTSNAVITEKDAKAYNRIHAGLVSKNGSRVYWGPTHSTNYSTMTNPSNLELGLFWTGNFGMGKPDLELSTVTPEDLIEAISVAKKKWDNIIGTNNPDLSGFQKRGGKLLTWHGLVDDSIVPQGTFSYKEKVNALMGGASAVDEFYRVFSAPGVGHCFGGNGPLPETAFDELVSWVEVGKAPEKLPAAITIDGVTTERNLCMYPLKARYKGLGDVHKASSWTCVE